MTINLPKIVDDLTGKIDYSAWNSLHKWTRSSLATAEILYHILEPIQEKRTKDRDESGDAGPAPEIDFSPIILSLAKAIEIEFEQHLLIPYKEYCESIGYTSILISKLKKDGSIHNISKLLADYLIGRKEALSMGETLSILACLDKSEGDFVLQPFKTWLRMNFFFAHHWWGSRKIAQKLQSQLLSDRNKAAHTGRFTPNQASISYEKLWGHKSAKGVISTALRCLDRIPQPGDVFDKYEISRPLLVKPGFCIFSGTQKHLNQASLLWMIYGDTETLYGATRRLEILRGFQHENLLPLTEWFPCSGKPSSNIMFVSHSNARMVQHLPISSHHISEDEILSAAISISGAVAALHEQNITHGFITPYSIFRENNKKWLLGGQAFQSIHNRRNPVYFYPRVLPPDHENQKHYIPSQRLDVFSLAATLCYLRQGNTTRNLSTVNANQVDNLFSDQKLNLVLKKALGLNKQEQYPSAIEFLAELWPQKKEQDVPRVFLCHNSINKPQVKEIALRLKEFGIYPWLDEWELRPGFAWQASLEEEIGTINSAAVFIGDDGIGPWQDQEISAFIRQFVKRGCPVIPVILPDCKKAPELPVFLEGMTWVDFRKSDPNPMMRLIWGITGKKLSK